jgi:UDP-N-acetylglucosamine 1-carboxyvinyltransferase
VGVVGVSGSLDERDRIVIRRSSPLSGVLRPGGAKNSVLKLMAAALLVEGKTQLTNVPGISDVGTMGALLEAMGVAVAWDQTHPDVLTLDVSAQIIPVAPFELADAIRASIVVLGPLLARCGQAQVALPGGDNFGTRPVDMHIRGLEALGAVIELRDGVLHATAPHGLHGASILLDFPSVGATENIVMAAIGATGTTILDNAAREPEIVDLLRLLCEMGANIDGIGSSRLVIEGRPVTEFRPVTHRVISDRLEVATFLASLAVVGGDIHIDDACASDMELFLFKLRQMGVDVTSTGRGLQASADGKIRSVDVATLPYPGIATDYKPLITMMLSLGDGVSIVTENLYAGRFRYVDELRVMGADIRTDGHHAVVRGVPGFRGAVVEAHDIRAGACLVAAGLAAEGETVITNPFHIDRGYENLVAKLAGVGADIQRCGPGVPAVSVVSELLTAV